MQIYTEYVRARVKCVRQRCTATINESYTQRDKLRKIGIATKKIKCIPNTQGRTTTKKKNEKRMQHYR